MPPWLKCYLQKLFLYGKIEKWLIQVNVTASAAESSELRLTETQSSIKCYGDKSLLSWQQWQQFKQQQSTQAPRKPQCCILQNVMGGADGKEGDEEATLDGGATVDGWGGRGTGRDGHINQPSVCSALHKPPRAVSKCCWQIKAIMGVGVAVAVRGSPVYSPSHCTFTPSPAHRCEIMVFAFICQRSIFQTSDKRGNWTGNRPKCCKSTKHNYQKALKLPNRIHILKMLKWMSPIHNESGFCSSATSFFWSWCSVLLQWSMVSTQHPPPQGRHCVLTGCY